MLGDFGFEKISSVVGGGEKRYLSVRNGFRATPPDSDMVLIHDAARPFVDNDTIKRVVEECARSGVSICAVPVTDTLKRADERNSFVSGTVSREKLWRAQTPQVFRREILEEIYSSSDMGDLGATDESVLAEIRGVRVGMVMGSDLNMKITTVDDFKIAEFIVSKGETV